MIKLLIAVVAQIFLFFVWLHLPAREIYEVPAHLILPILILLPLLSYRYLILTPLIAMIPDFARIFDTEFFHSIESLPIIFAFAALPFVRRPKTALIAGYAAMACVASHLIVDARRHVIVTDVGGYPFSEMVLLSLVLTFIGFMLALALKRPGLPHGRVDRIE